MFIGYFFKGNPNSEVSRVTKAISRVQGNNKNSNSRDQYGINRRYNGFVHNPIYTLLSP